MSSVEERDVFAISTCYKKLTIRWIYYSSEMFIFAGVLSRIEVLFQSASPNVIFGFDDAFELQVINVPEANLTVKWYRSDLVYICRVKFEAD